MKKIHIRKKYKTLRQQISNENLEDYSITIANNLLRLDIWSHSFYHIFLPMENHKEVNTAYILNILSGKDKNIVISKSNFENYSMTHFLLTDATLLKQNSFGIPEPIDGIEIPTNQIDVVFVPLLAYDHNGNRIGYGKGFYDRFLCKCRPSVLKIGVSFFAPEFDNIESDYNDIKLDFCITPATIFKF